MGASKKVLLYPPDKSPTGRFMLAFVEEPGGRFTGFATDTGSTDDFFLMDMQQGKTFSSSEDAISWAEAQGWQVINKALFGRTPLVAPDRMTVSVLEATYAPWFVIHPTIEQRKEAGEKVLQIQIKFRALDVLTSMGGCYLTIDAEAERRLQPLGIKSASDLIGHTLELQSEDRSDPFRPFRLVRIIR